MFQTIKQLLNNFQEWMKWGSKRNYFNKNKPLRLIQKEEMTDDFLMEVIKRDAKLWIGNFENEKIAREIKSNINRGIKITLKGSFINHSLKRHSTNSTMVKNGQPPITLEDIKEHSEIVNSADFYGIIPNNDGGFYLVSAKQINGYFAVVETISTKANELRLKTCFREMGHISEKSNCFKDVTKIFKIDKIEPLDSQKALPSLQNKPLNPLEQSPSNNLDDSHTFCTSNTIPQPTTFVKPNDPTDNYTNSSYGEPKKLCR